jgi:hypothetical protein
MTTNLYIPARLNPDVDAWVINNINPTSGLEPTARYANGKIKSWPTLEKAQAAADTMTRLATLANPDGSMKEGTTETFQDIFIDSFDQLDSKEILNLLTTFVRQSDIATTFAVMKEISEKKGHGEIK